MENQKVIKVGIKGYPAELLSNSELVGWCGCGEGNGKCRVCSEYGGTPPAWLLLVARSFQEVNILALSG